MAKIKRTAQPKKTVNKKTAVKKTVSKTALVNNLLKNPQLKQISFKLQKMNLLPVATFLVAVFVLVALFVFIRKTVIVATVNGQPLTRFEVISTLEKQSGQQVVDSMVSKALLLQKAKQDKIEIDATVIQTEVDEIKKQLQAQGNELPTVLAAQGLTQKDLEEQIKLRLILEKLLEDKTKVTDKEVVKYIEENRDSFPEEMKQDELVKTVREQLVNQKLSANAQDLLAQLKEQANIKYYITY